MDCVYVIPSEFRDKHCPILLIDDKKLFASYLDEYNYCVEEQLENQFSVISRKSEKVEFEVDKGKTNKVKEYSRTLLHSLLKREKDKAGSTLDKLWMELKPDSSQLDLEYTRLRTDGVLGGFYCRESNSWSVLLNKDLKYDSI